MNLAEAFRSAHDGISSHKMRSGLTMLGIMFGVGAVISMLSIGAGAAQQAQAIIDRMGLRNIVVRAKQLRPDDLQAVRKKSQGVSSRDVEAIRDAVPGVEAVAPRLRIEPWKVQADAQPARRTRPLQAASEPKGRIPVETGVGGAATALASRTEASVFGVSHQLRQLVHMPLAEGRFIDALDEKEHAQVCVLGAAVRRDLFAHGPALGRHVKINDLWCEVIGVIADAGAPGNAGARAGAPAGAQASGRLSPGGASGTGAGAGAVTGAGSTARDIYLPLSTAARRLEHEPLASPLDEILIGLAPGVRSREAGAVIRTLVDGLHAGADDYEVVIPEALLEQSRQTQNLFNLVMGCIAGISLLVGGIGIMNIMLASVLERTREIGVRRAIGADQRDILLQFLVESFSISAIGGLAGVAIGVGIAHGVSTYARWPTVVTMASIALAITVSVAVGILSGLYPALRAARVAPIEALRYE